jgi:hypothetical protein
VGLKPLLSVVTVVVIVIVLIVIVPIIVYLRGVVTPADTIPSNPIIPFVLVIVSQPHYNPASLISEAAPHFQRAVLARLEIGAIRTLGHALAPHLVGGGGADDVGGVNNVRRDGTGPGRPRLNHRVAAFGQDEGTREHGVVTLVSARQAVPDGGPQLDGGEVNQRISSKFAALGHGREAQPTRTRIRIGHRDGFREHHGTRGAGGEEVEGGHGGGYKSQIYK